MGFFSSIKRLWSSNKPAETQETPQAPAEEALAGPQPAETEGGASHEEPSASDAPQSPVEFSEKLPETAAVEQQQADLERDQPVAGQSLEPDGQAPVPAAAAQPAPQPSAPEKPSGWRDTLLLTLREAEPRLSVWLSIAFATVLTIVTVAMTRLVLVWTNTPADIIDLADIYIRTIFAGIPFTLLYNVTSALMRALGDSKRPLYFLLVASVLNIGLDLACIIVLNMGAFGAAFATVFSQAVAGLGSLLYIMRHYPELRWSREEGRFSLTHCAKLCNMGIPMGLQCSITAIGSVVLQGAVNGLGSDIVAAQTAGGKAAQFLSVPLESIGTAMTTYTSQNMGAKDLGRVNRGVNTALGIGCVYSVASFLILRVTDKLLIGLFLDASETAIMANAQSFIFWNSVFYIPLAVLIIYRYTIQGLGFSGLAMFAGVAEMIARAMVGFWFVPLWGYFAACIASPVAWFFACFFLIPAYFVVRKRLQKEKDIEKEHDARTANA